jgi:hypothetical protein
MGYRIGEPLPCMLCGNPSIGRKLCRPCYERAKRKGTLDDYPVLGPQDVFWTRVQKTETCWLWTGTHNQGGYGIFLLPGEVPVRAHRYAYEQVKGPIPAGLILLHSCDNPPCVNPDHLTPGTRKDNLYDSMAKGRRPKGAKHWNSKMTDAQAQKIKDAPKTTAARKALAAEIGVNLSTVYRIQFGQRR